MTYDCRVNKFMERRHQQLSGYVGSWFHYAPPHLAPLAGGIIYLERIRHLPLHCTGQWRDWTIFAHCQPDEAHFPTGVLRSGLEVPQTEIFTNNFPGILSLNSGRMCLFSWILIHNSGIMTFYSGIMFHYSWRTSPYSGITGHFSGIIWLFYGIMVRFSGIMSSN